MNSGKRKRGYEERPKVKIDIPGTECWSLVITSRGRAFAHNRKTGQSVWTPPSEVARHVENEMDKSQLILLIAQIRGLQMHLEPPESEPEDLVTEQQLADPEPLEVESVSEDEARQESSENELDDNILEELLQDDEDDDDGDDNFSAGQFPELDEETKRSTFYEMLTDCTVNPYGEWTSELSKVVNDDRYTVYSTQKDRQDAFNEWARKAVSGGADSDRSQAISDTAEQLFLEFIVANYKPTMFFVQFKRKFRNNTAFAHSSLTDSEKEKLFRDYSMLRKGPTDMRIKAFRADVEKHKQSLKSSSQLQFSFPSYYALDSDADRQLVLSEVLGQSSSCLTKSEEALLLRQRQVKAECVQREKGLNKAREKHARARQHVVDSITQADPTSSLQQYLD